MLKVQRPRKNSGAGLRIAIVASRYNEVHVEGMLSAARQHLVQAGASVEEVRVPGAFEIPVAVACLLRRSGSRPHAVLCLGVIWVGETLHAQHIGEAVTSALMDLQVAAAIPCIHEVLTVSSEEQARARCLDPKTNRGLEAAATALEMGRLVRDLGLGGK